MLDDRVERAPAPRLLAVRLDPSRCRLRVVDVYRGMQGRGATADEVCPSIGAAVNASFFAEDRSPLGLLVVNGRLVQSRFPRHEWGVFRVRRGQVEIVRSTGERAAGVTQALESKPRLIVDGKIQSFKPQGPARRSAIGIDGSGRVLLVATMEYLTLDEWAALLARDFGCRQALNLDGGPSTQLTIRGSTVLSVHGGWPVPVFITAEPRAAAGPGLRW